MKTTPKNRTELAAWLGIAKSAVSEQAKRGMPTNNLEAAQLWRKANINPARRKGSRFDKFYQPCPPPATPPEHSAVAQATALMAAASSLIETGQSIAALVPCLRAALRAVPMTHRDDVGLSLRVMDTLISHVIALLPSDKDALNEDGSMVYLDRDMTDDEAQEQGEFFYSVAAGEFEFAVDVAPSQSQTSEH